MILLIFLLVFGKCTYPMTGLETLVHV